MARIDKALANYKRKESRTPPAELAEPEYAGDHTLGPTIRAPTVASAADKPRWPDPKYVTELSADRASVDWLWNGCVALGHTTLFSALMKAGKTTMLSFLLRSLQVGDSFVGRETRECRTLIVSEESETIWSMRRDALGLDEHLSVLSKPMIAKPNFGDWSDFIEFVDAKAGERDCELVVFDTIGKFAPWKSENDAAEVQGTMNPLDILTKNHRGVLLFHHHGKNDSGEGRAARGSTAMAGAVDILLELRRYKPDDKADRRRVLSGLGRFDEVPEEIVIALETDGSGYTAEGDRKALAARELGDTVRDCMPAEPPGATADEIHKAMPEGARPRVGDVRKCLIEGSSAGHWNRTGLGKPPKNPWRFWRSEM
jgi:hypothetical protein